MLARLLQLRCALCDGSAEPAGAAARQQGGLHRHEFPRDDGLAQLRDVSDLGLRRGALDEPGTREGVTLREDGGAVQPGRLEAGEEERRVEAGRQFFGDDARRGADLLTRSLERGGGHGIGELQSLHRRPDRGGQRPDPRGVAALVALQTARQATLFQDRGGALQNLCHMSIAGLHEGRQQLPQLGEPAPLVACQQVDRALRREGIAARLERGLESDDAALGLVESVRNAPSSVTSRLTSISVSFGLRAANVHSRGLAKAG